MSKQALRQAVRTTLAEAERQREIGELDAAWLRLERAHILSQSRPWLHTVVHWRMFTLALRTRRTTPGARPLPWWREALGQVVRLVVAGPGTLLGRAPLGNTGRANVGILTPMPLSEELANELRSYGVALQPTPNTAARRAT